MIQQMAFSVHLASSVFDMKLRETVITRTYTLYKVDQWEISKPEACTHTASPNNSKAGPHLKISVEEDIF